MKYFDKILNSNQKHPQTFFGLSLSLFKLERYQDALVDIQAAIALLPSDNNAYSYIWIRGLCYKELAQYDLATKDFEYLKSFDKAKTLKEIHAENFSKPEFINTCIRDKENPHKLITDDMYIENDGWKHGYLEKSSRVIRRVSFFRRFSTMTIRSYLGYMTIKTFSAQQIVFIPKDTACIVMGGAMKLQKFCGKTNKSILTQLLLQGDFLFNSVSFRPPTDFWLESITPIQLLFMDKKYFERLWEMMKKSDTQLVVGRCEIITK